MDISLLKKQGPNAALGRHRDSIQFSASWRTNGVVLGTGDFIHTTPKGFKQLKAGAKIEAEGEAPPREWARKCGRSSEDQREIGEGVIRYGLAYR